MNFTFIVKIVESAVAVVVNAVAVVAAVVVVLAKGRHARILSFFTLPSHLLIFLSIFLHCKYYQPT